LLLYFIDSLGLPQVPFLFNDFPLIPVLERFSLLKDGSLKEEEMNTLKGWDEETSPL
jgi:hypothetical protein